MSKKILFVSSFEKIGGSNTVIWDLGKTFVNYGYSISVLYPNSHPMHSKLLEDGINVVINQEIFHQVDKNLEFFKQFDLVILNEWSCYKFVHQIKKNGTPVMWIIHGNNRKRFELFKINEFDFSLPDKIICVSDYVKRSFIDFQTKNNFLTIHNGVDIQRIQNFIHENNKNKIRKKFELPENHIVISIIGRFSENKAFHVFIEMANIMSQSNFMSQSNISNLRFVIAGFGTKEETQKIQSLITKYNLQSKLSLILHPQDIFEIYLMSDIFVTCSFREGFPLVLLEAMVFNLPIITTNVGGIPELMTDGINGFLIDPGDPITLSKKIKFLLNNLKILDNFVNNNKRRVREFDIKKTAISYKNIIEELCNYKF